MLIDLVKALEGMELDYTLVSLKRIDMPFDNFIASIVIRDRYNVYIVQEGDIIDYKEGCETVGEALDFVTFIDLVLGEL